MIRKLQLLCRSLWNDQLNSKLKPKSDRVIKEEHVFVSLFTDGHAARASRRRLLTAFDSSGSAIKSSYIIFITGRCGSTLLTRLIKATQLAGDPDEYLNIDYIKRFVGVDLFLHTLKRSFVGLQAMNASG
jgi:hypothetical protein